MVCVELHVLCLLVLVHSLARSLFFVSYFFAGREGESGGPVAGEALAPAGGTAQDGRAQPLREEALGMKAVIRPTIRNRELVPSSAGIVLRLNGGVDHDPFKRATLSVAINSRRLPGAGGGILC